MVQIEVIDIRNIVFDLKNDNKFQTKENLDNFLIDSLSSGVDYKEKLIEVSHQKIINPLTKNTNIRFNFICPSCGKNSNKIFFLKDDFGCRICCKIKNKRNVKSKADKILKIQEYTKQLFSKENISSKKKKRLTNLIVQHYNSLEDKYKLAYNTFIFKEIQNWCLDNIINNDKSDDYKMAVKEVLDILNSSKKILVQTSLVKYSKKHHII